MLEQRHLRDRLLAMAAPAVVVATIAAALVGAGVGDGRVGLYLLACVTLSAIWGVLQARSIIGSIDDLTETTTRLGLAQGRLAAGEPAPDSLPAVDADHSGPLGRLAAAVVGMGSAAVEASQVQRETVRKGLATMVIDLARRNQSLLDRQVELLDELERTEEDPERLDQLFRVDHLSTRMRRNAESLLVLAGADSGRRRGAPVPITDVLRVAIGEVENYRRIELGRVDDGLVPAGAAVDLAHLTAELMENATQFSPPSTTVTVQAVIDRTAGCYRIAVSDQGMGLGDRLDSANRTIAEPPELGLGLGRSLGFMVVGRLARRLGATVRLGGNGDAGTVAVASIPLSVLVSETPTTTATAGPIPAPEPLVGDVTPPPPLPPAGTAIEAAPPPGPAPAEVSTTLEKLLGIERATPATRPTTSPTPPPPLPAPPDRVDWQDTSPFAEGPFAEGAFAERPFAEGTLAEGTFAEGPAPAAPASEAWPPPDHRPDRRSETNPAQPPAASPRSPEPTELPPIAYGPPPTGADEAARAGNASGRPEPGHDRFGWPTPGPEADYPRNLGEAVPSGRAFDAGVAALLSSDGIDRDPPTPDRPGAGLTRRERGASGVPIGEGRPVAAPKRSPEEVRSVLSRYRDGLRRGGRNSPEPPGPDSSPGPGPAPRPGSDEPPETTAPDDEQQGGYWS